MNEKLTKKPKNVDYFHVPRLLWCRLRRLLPKPKPHPRGGRPPADNRAIMNGIWYVLWTGCQWKAIQRDWFGVCSSVLHERIQEWQRSGIFLKLLLLMVRFYARQRGIQWLFQAIDSKSCPAPLGGEASGKSPVDRSKRGSKVHVLVDQRGVPLSLHITGANVHDKWLADELIVSIIVPRPDPAVVEQHICLDKGYDFPDVHQFVELERYRVHIKHRRRRGEPVVEACPVQEKPNIPLAAGSLSVPSVGSPSVAVFGYVRARKPITGWDSFNSLVLTFLWT